MDARTNRTSVSEVSKSINLLGFKTLKAGTDDYPKSTVFCCDTLPDGRVRIEPVLGLEEARRIERDAFEEWKSGNGLPSKSLGKNIEEALWVAFKKDGVSTATSEAETQALIGWVVRLAASLGKQGVEPTYDSANGPALIVDLAA